MAADLPADRLKAVGDKAQALGKLDTNEGWILLKSEWAKQKQDYEQSLSRRLLSGGKDAEPVNQRDIDYQRGYWRGVQAILGSPDAAKAALVEAQKRMEGHA